MSSELLHLVKQVGQFFLYAGAIVGGTYAFYDTSRSFAYWKTHIVTKDDVKDMTGLTEGLKQDMKDMNDKLDLMMSQYSIVQSGSSAANTRVDGIDKTK